MIDRKDYYEHHESKESLMQGQTSDLEHYLRHWPIDLDPCDTDGVQMWACRVCGEVYYNSADARECCTEQEGEP